MLFEIKKVFNVNTNENFENVLYTSFVTQCSDAIVTKEENNITVKPKSHLGLYYNSFKPKIHLQFLNSKKTLTVTFELQLFTKIVCFLIWAVGLFYGYVCIVNDKDFVSAIVSFMSIAVISYLFVLNGLSIASLKYTKIIKEIITQVENQSGQSD